MPTATPPTPISRVDSNPFDPTPLGEKRPCPGLEAQPQPQETSDVDCAVRLFAPVPPTYTANYAAYSTSFLSPFDIEEHWDDPPIVLNNFNSETVPEVQFLDAVGRVSVYDYFKDRIVKATVIDFGSSFDDPRSYRFLATYSHLMDTNKAYIRLIAYDRKGFRCDLSHPEFGNFILVVPRQLNNVVFPVQLRFHAMHATDICHVPDEAHHRIQNSAKNALTKLEKAWWDCGHCAICDTDL
jgi:hypothetical protein